jgi:hypothetical protein
VRPLRWQIGDAMDEWCHRRGFAMSNGRPAGWQQILAPCRWLCNRRELSFGAPTEQIYGGYTTSAGTTVSMTWRDGNGHRC